MLLNILKSKKKNNLKIFELYNVIQDELSND